MIIVSSFVLNVDHRHRDHRHRDHRYRDNYFNVSNFWDVLWMYLSETLELGKVGKGSGGYLLKSACPTIALERHFGELEPEREKKSKNRCEVLNS